jgi:T5orf172 domain
MDSRRKRLSEFEKIPFFARLDHRWILDEDGRLPFLKGMSRNKRRNLKAAADRIGRQYKDILGHIMTSGVGFPIDQLVRSMALEYTNRFASSGTENLPVSFNYFESFCEGKLIPKSVAPYMDILPETNHLFNAPDFFDYLTSSDSDSFTPSHLLSLPDSRVYHFTANGNILDLSFTDARSREYVLSGFSLVRRGNSIHWCLVAGESLSEEQWKLRSADEMSIDLNNVTASKRAFFQKVLEEQGNTTGPPMRLEGTEAAIKTVLAGEFDAYTGRHVGKSVFVEFENSYDVFCDDPEVLFPIRDSKEKDAIIERAMGRITEAGALFSIAEGLFQLPTYFESRITISQDVAGSRSIPRGLKGKGGRGIAANYKVVESVAVTNDSEPPIVRKVELPQYSTETEGHWRRLGFGESGKDREGNPVAGKTWVNRSSPWRSQQDRESTIYVKDSLAVAKARVAELYLDAQKSEGGGDKAEQAQGVLYVLRCTLMEEEVYKVGWTSGTARDRAKDLSAATGVPLAFVVVESLKHDDAEALETEVHAILSPYRVNTQREFFQLELSAMKRIIEQTIARLRDKIGE